MRAIRSLFGICSDRDHAYAQRHAVDVNSDTIDLGFEPFEAHLEFLGSFARHVPAHHAFTVAVSVTYETRRRPRDEAGNIRDDSSEYRSKGTRTPNKIQPGGDSRDREYAQGRLKDLQFVVVSQFD